MAALTCIVLALQSSGKKRKLIIQIRGVECACMCVFSQTYVCVWGEEETKQQCNEALRRRRESWRAEMTNAW